MLEIKNLTVSYSNNKPVIKDINFIAREKEKIAIVGPNGSGKSTFIKAILGIAPIVKGNVKIFGKEVQNLRKELRVAANLPELYRLFNSKVKELVEVFSELKEIDRERYFKLVEYFDLEEILDKKVHELSSGQAKMFGNIMAIAPYPKLMLLDEPFESVDQNRRIKLMKIFQDYTESIILVTHEFDILRKFQNWSLYFVIEGKMYGSFKISDLDDLYISKGEKEEALIKIETSLGSFSITKGKGEVSLKYATSFNKLIEDIV